LSSFLRLDLSGRLWHHPATGEPQQLTGVPLASVQWQAPIPARAHWPCFSPDRQQAAAWVEHPDGFAVHRFRLDGSEEHQSQTVVTDTPMYLSWSPDGRHLGLLYQVDQHVELALVEHAEGTTTPPLLFGSPVYITWQDHHLACFVGHHPDEETELHRIDPDDPREGTTSPWSPRHFCAPCWVGGFLYIVAGQDDDDMLTRLTPDHRAGKPMEFTEGLVALTTDGSGALLRASAQEGDGDNYTQLGILFAESEDFVEIPAPPCLAFYWRPVAKRVIIVTLDEERGVLAFGEFDPVTHTQRDLIAIRPTPEMAYLMRFFEQFCRSHPIVSHDGSSLFVSGVLDSEPEGTAPCIWEVHLADGQITCHGTGVLAVLPAHPAIDDRA